MTPEEIAAAAVGNFGAMQKPAELAVLLDFLTPRRPRNVVEIGGMFGGTTWSWDQVRDPGGRLVCVDLFVLEGRMENAWGVDVRLVRGDSTLPATRANVEALLEGEPVDLLFIDGDHRYEAVRADWENFRSLLAPGGVAAFHDICHRPMVDHDMWRFWSEVAPDWERFAIYDPSEPWGGIGVVVAPGGEPLLTQPSGAVTLTESPHPPRSCSDCGVVLLLREDICCAACAGIRSAVLAASG